MSNGLRNLLRRFLAAPYFYIVFFTGWFLLPPLLTFLWLTVVSPRTIRLNPIFVLLFFIVLNVILLVISWVVERENLDAVVENESDESTKLLPTSASFQPDTPAELAFESRQAATTPEVNYHEPSYWPPIPKDYNLLVIGSLVISFPISSFLFLVVNQAVEHSRDNRGIGVLPHLSYFVLTAASFIVGVLLSKKRESLHDSLQYMGSFFGITIGASLGMMLTLIPTRNDPWAFRVFLYSRLIEGAFMLATALANIRISYALENLRRRRTWPVDSHNP